MTENGGSATHLQLANDDGLGPRDELCPITLEPLCDIVRARGHDAVTVLPCGHRFETAAIRRHALTSAEWLVHDEPETHGDSALIVSRTDQPKATCPLCRWPFECAWVGLDDVTVKTHPRRNSDDGDGGDDEDSDSESDNDDNDDGNGHNATRQSYDTTVFAPTGLSTNVQTYFERPASAARGLRRRVPITTTNLDSVGMLAFALDGVNAAAHASPLADPSTGAETFVSALLRTQALLAPSEYERIVFSDTDDSQGEPEHEEGGEHYSGADDDNNNNSNDDDHSSGEPLAQNEYETDFIDDSEENEAALRCRADNDEYMPSESDSSDNDDDGDMVVEN